MTPQRPLKTHSKIYCLGIWLALMFILCNLTVGMKACKHGGYNGSEDELLNWDVSCVNSQTSFSVI